MAVSERNTRASEAVYSDVISGSAGKHPQLDALTESVIRRGVDVVLAWDVSRFGRSLKHLIRLIGIFMPQALT